MSTKLLLAGLVVAALSACQGAPPSAAPKLPVPSATTAQVPAPTSVPTPSITDRPTTPPSPPLVSGLFRPEVVLPLHEDPGSVVVADVDANKTADILTANWNGTLTVLLGSGTGTFAEATLATGGYGPTSLAVADLDADDHLDLVVVHTGDSDLGAGSDDLIVLLGTGDGTFETGTPRPIGLNAQAVVVGDFDRDGKWDLATANASDSVAVFRGTGLGTFDQPVSHAIGAPYASGIAITDLDADGDLDLVTANSLIGRGRSNRTLSVLRGAKGASFAPPIVYRVNGPQPIYPRIADVNGDGVPDVTTPNGYPAPGVSVFIANADGSLAPSVGYATGPNPHSVVADDLDGDGHLDLAAWNSGEMGGPKGKGLSLLLGRGDGTFGEHVDVPTRAVGGDVMAVADFDADGRHDLVVSGTASLILLFNSMTP